MDRSIKLVLEDGKVFEGRIFSASGERYGELVFNTAMSGYQEVLTDPSYAKQMVMMTYPLIGNYGVNEEDVESNSLFLEALIVREYTDEYSNFRATGSLKEYLDHYNVLGVEGFDTRAITRYVREKGSQRALLSNEKVSEKALIEKVKASQGMAGLNVASQVTCSTAYDWKVPEKPKYKVAVLDFGVKWNILRQLQAHGCECKVFPADTPAQTILDGGFDGLFLSNGPGDPEPVTEAINTVESALGKLPIFGICLGHQILTHALGGKTYKLKFGHHGANHPVKQLSTGKVEITSQNHGFCADEDSFGDDIEVTHRNLYDGTNEGIRHKTLPAFSVQYHPEASPGPHDSHYLFQDFIRLMETSQNDS
ncbi:glutamine-hydrolyzing carbamoyl-phosphate synthase small subunit [bacterium]|jgi:carbamoyl-phosphate synthase small subunit|nr:glutamine-hydrolyzing carbamoyl-phosphate synthase small subunit [bacterium]